MSLLLDRILTTQVLMTADWYQYTGAKVMELLDRATAVVCDNVERYWEETAPDTTGDKFQRMIPKILSPLSPAFFEAKPVGHLSKFMRSFGALVHTRDLENERHSQANGARFLTESWLFFEPKEENGKVHPPQAFSHYTWPAFENGLPVIEQHPLRKLVAVDTNQIDLIRDVSNRMMYPFYLAMSFMHCRNVELQEKTPHFIEQKPWRKKYDRSLVRYYVLNIDPMKRVLRVEGGVKNNGLQKALHICRGHFATYTEAAPLFGRVVGTVWKPQHVRGTSKHGVVLKDYSVQPKTERE